MSLIGEGRAAAGRVEEALCAWVAIVSRGVSPADLDTINVVFDQFYANAREYSCQVSASVVKVPKTGT